MNKSSKIEEIYCDSSIQIVTDLETLARFHVEQSEAGVSEEASQPPRLEPETTDKKPLPASREVEIILPTKKVEVDNFSEPEIVEPKTEKISHLEIEVVETTEVSQPLEPPVVEQPVIFETYSEEEVDETDAEQELVMESRIITEDGAPIVEATAEVFEQPTLPDSAVLEIFEEIEVRINSLEPEEIEATNEILGKIIEITTEIQNPETTQDFVEVEAVLIELCGELFESLGLDYSKEETRQVVRMWITYSRMNFSPEENTNSGFKHLFDDMGTHEGLKQFMTNLSRIKRVVEVINSALGKFALSVLQIREHDKQLAIQPIV